MPASVRPRLYLIDGYSNIFRAFYAIRDLSNSKGLPTNAVYGFVTMLRKLLKEHQPELVGVALDVGGPSVRSERFEGYKANRIPMPPDLAPQIEWVRRAIEAYRIPAIEAPRYEADDVLGTLAKKAAAAGYDVVLVSADKDLFQLVDEHVGLLHTGRNKLYDQAAVEEDLGVPPEKVVDLLALKGDSVDNIPGVPGIGEKGARDLIRQFGSLEALLERSGEVGRKSYREGLQQHREQALLSKELVTIHTDLPVELDVAALRLDRPDTEALRSLFAELEFFSLLEELEASAHTVETASEPAEEPPDAAAWRELAGGLSSPVVAALVARDSGDGAAPVGLAVAGATGGPLFADFRRPGLREAATSLLASWLADPAFQIAGHDLKEVLRLLPSGSPPAARLFDTMLVSYLLRPALRGTSLEDVALERLGYKALTAREAGWEAGAGGALPMLGAEALLRYAGERADLARRLAPSLGAELSAPGHDALTRVYRDLEEPLLPVLLAMEETGILLDTALLAEMSERLGRELGDLEEEIYDLADERFNLNSPPQLGEILYGKLGYPVLKKTRKTRSRATDADTLQELANRGFPLPVKLLRYRELAKLKSTYVDAFPLLLGPDGRLHTLYQQAVAATGRLSSIHPNLQNIPVRGEQGQQIRRAFVAPPGRALLVADYSQIELRVLAHIAGEQALLDAFAAGEDIHRATAAVVFGISPQLVSPAQRRAAKTINFGILYGMSAFGLAQNLGIERGEADRFIKAYLERYPGVRRYIEETLAGAEATGKVETLYGRVRWLPDIHSRNWNLRENARRMAINARIQGTAADLLKKAMIAVDRRLRAEAPEARLLLTVHDELVLEVPETEGERLAEMVKAEMQGVEELAAPLVVEAGWGRSWYEAKG